MHNLHSCEAGSMKIIHSPFR